MNELLNNDESKAQRADPLGSSELSIYPSHSVAALLNDNSSEPLLCSFDKC